MLKIICIYNISTIPKSFKCVNPTCMLCAVNIMFIYLDLVHSSSSSINHDKSTYRTHRRSKTISAPKPTNMALLRLSPSLIANMEWLLGSEKNSVNDNAKHAKPVNSVHKNVKIFICF